MKPTYLILLLVLAALPRLSAQTVLLEEYVDSVGPLNEASDDVSVIEQSSVAGHFGIGLALDPEEMAERTGVAWNWGFMYRYRVGGLLSLLMDLRVSHVQNNFNLLEDNPQGIEFRYRRSRWITGEVALGPRIHLDPSEKNDIGTYLAFEGFAGYVLDNRIKERYALPGADGSWQASKIVSFNTNTRIVYGLGASLGKNYHSLSFQYRFSELTGNSSSGALGGYGQMNVTPILITYQLGIY